MSFLKTFCSDIVETFNIINEMEASGSFEERLTKQRSNDLILQKLRHDFSHLFIIVVESRQPDGITEDVSDIYIAFMTSMYAMLECCEMNVNDFVNHGVRQACDYRTLGSNSKAMYYRHTYHALECLKSSVYETITNRRRLDESREEALNDFLTILKDAAKELKPFAEDEPSSTSSGSDSPDN